MHKLELHDFKFKDRFLDLTDMQFQSALQIVNAQFSGVYSLWASLPPDEATAKRELCINYLLGWQLTVLYPNQAIDAGSTGSMPLASKRIDKISIKYRDTLRQAGSGTLDMLTTNSYGLQALQMIQNAPENYVLY